MKLTDRLAISPQVVAREVGTETVILDLASGTYFGLDPIGARVWKLAESGKTLVEVCDIMLDEYEVAREQLEQDVLALAGQLEEKLLVKAA